MTICLHALIQNISLGVGEGGGKNVQEVQELFLVIYYENLISLNFSGGGGGVRRPGSLDLRIVYGIMAI